MKILSHWIDEESGLLKLWLASENQEESSLLISYANRIKLPVENYGRVDKSYTWMWLQIPIKKPDYRAGYFGNDRMVVK